jgi:hypothetical protein
MSDMTVMDVKVKIQPIDPNNRGFVQMYRQAIAVKRAFLDFDHAIPEDVDAGIKLVMDHMAEPSNPADKKRLIDNMTATEFTDILSAITGAGAVPPANGGA